MIKKYRKSLIITTIITLLPIVVGIILWDSLPERIATHFGADNEANGWSSKWFAVFGLPLFLAGLEWLCMFATSLDPKSKNISGKSMGVILWLIPILSLLCSTAIYTYAMGLKFNFTRIVLIFFGLLLIVIGNYLPKSSQNYSMGIKISWTLNDEDNWNHTHRFAGRLWVLCGAVSVLCSVFGAVWLFFAVIIVAVAAPIIYSYCYYKKHK